MGKYQQLDRKYEMEELNTQSDARMQSIKQIFDSFGLKSEIVR
jgi:hypothetical protein